jgi:hypothetical protein
MKSLLPFSFLLTAVLGLLHAGNAAAMDALWISPPAPTVSEAIRLSVTVPDTLDAGALLRLAAVAESRFEFGGAMASLVLLNEAGESLRQSQHQMDLERGPNDFSFDLDTAGLPEGRYMVEIALQYSERDDTAVVSVPVRHVSSASLQAQVAAQQARLDALAATSGADARIGLCREVVQQAQADAQGANWRVLAAKTDYLEGALNRIAAGMVFSGTAGPAAVAPVDSTQAISFTPQGFSLHGHPAYPLGLSLDTANLDGLDRAKRLGCQWVTVNVGPGDTLDAAGAPQSLSTLSAFFARAQELGLLVTVRLRPDRIGASMIQRHPEIEGKGFADIDQAPARVLFERHLETVLPLLTAQSCIGAVELVAYPHFQFEEERYRQLFIKHVQTNYPDRIDLNRQWRSHLATYEEITLKGEKDYSYQNHRPFQYDWQTFHRNLALQYLTWAEGKVRALAPTLPLYISFADNAFDEGVAVYEPSREAAAGLFVANGITASVDTGHDLYALTYPGQSALSALTRSFAPEKPLLVSDYSITTDSGSGVASYDLARTALWELYVSGADGIALAPSSPVLNDPAALEALLTVRAEVNAWAPVIRAFHQAVPEVGILFSGASKILDNGDPHLKSARFAFEGATFSGYKVDFITEDQCITGKLTNLPVLIIPDTPALSDEAFKAIGDHVQQGAAVARTGKPIPYNERGTSRHDVVRNTGNTILVRGLNLPTEYLHAMDALIDRGVLPRIPHPVNAFGFPLEGVKSRYVEVDGQPYLYIVNLRPIPVRCHVAGAMTSGRDVLTQQAIQFPRELEPLKPMLIALNKQEHAVQVAAEPAAE